MKNKRGLFCAGLCLLLAGCGGEADQVETEPITQDQVSTILACGAFSEELEAVDSDLICMLYGVDETVVTQCTGYLSTGATAEELVLFELTDETAAESVAAACQQHLTDQGEAYADYNPGEVEKLDGAILVTQGNTVLLVVADDAETVRHTVDSW